MPTDVLEAHLFRREAVRMTAALTRIFGVHNLALVEDVVQDAYCRALEVWKVRGVPDNPGAWLMATAKNRALDVLRQRRTAETFAPELASLLESAWTCAAIVDESFVENTIRDEQLRMIFTCCHPSLPDEEQLALVLSVSCGFGAAEIAAAFFKERAAIDKRIARGKKHLAAARCLFDLASAEIPARLPNVLRAIYLLFNEGYHGAAPSGGGVRDDLSAEAIRLVALLVDHPTTATPSSYALGALLCLHAARLPARVDASGELVPLAEQDRARWDPELVAKGLAWFDASATGESLSSFHVEAAIAVTHAGATSTRDVDWARVVSLYDRLASLAPSPVVALNRAIAIALRDGPEVGLAVLDAFTTEERTTLARYPFFAATFAEIALRAHRRDVARAHFARALAVARNAVERRYFERRLAALKT